MRKFNASPTTAIAIVLVAFTTLGFSSSVALARQGHVVALGTHDEKDIKNHCDAAGGSSYSSGGTYGCFGPGGDVHCSGQTKKCFGSCENCGSAARLSAKGGVAGFLTSPTGLKQTTSAPTTSLKQTTSAPTTSPKQTTGTPTTSLKQTTGGPLGTKNISVPTPGTKK